MKADARMKADGVDTGLAQMLASVKEATEGGLRLPLPANGGPYTLDVMAAFESYDNSLSEWYDRLSFDVAKLLKKRDKLRAVLAAIEEAKGAAK